MSRTPRDGQLPPGQLATGKFPIIGEREPEPFNAATWRLTVDGLVEEPLSIGWDEFTALPRSARTVDVHCVTRWSRLRTGFAGVAVETLLDRARPAAGARFVRFISGRGHDSSLPLDYCAGNVLLADQVDIGGALERLPPGHGGPLRSVTAGRYFYKSVKWVRRIELTGEDHLGFWERSAGYHNAADPWKEQRYIARGVDRAVLRNLLHARDLSGHDLLGADLKGMDLAGMRMVGTLLRNVDLRGAHLAGADLTGANLSNADLRDADIRDAELTGTDLEGADMRRANLLGARGSPASLTATEFVSPGGADDGAHVCCVDWRETPLEGILSEQLEYLRRSGARLAER